MSLVRGLGLMAAISMIVGNVIGTGVFLKARVMTCNVGSPEWVLLAWIAAGILSLAGALTYAELSAMKPEAGGEYVFLRDAYGKVSSFLFGWMQIFIAKTGSQAAVAVAFAVFLNDFLGGGLKQTLFKTDILGYVYELTSLQIIAVMMIVIVTTINCASVAIGGQIATVLTFVKIGLILLVGFGAFFLADGNWGNYSMVNDGGACEAVAESARYGIDGNTFRAGLGFLETMTVVKAFLAGFGAAMLGALWGYDGWNNLSLVAGEVDNPKRNIPLALIGGTILIIFLYVFINFAYFYVLTPTEIASVSKDSSVAREVAVKFFGAGALVLMTTGLMLSSLGTLHTSILAGSRVPYAMAQDGVMFKSLGRLSATRVPVLALVAQGLWACLLALSGSFDALTDYVIFGSWIFYALATASVFVFRQKYPDMERPYKAWGYPVVPVLFLLVAGWLLINTLMTSPTQSFIGIFLILAGLPVYYYLTAGKTGNTDGKTE
ncbi:MAG: amino acid permease [Acidobacteria bacterium]|nr:amino acid permease [Acidobacteriota bacterium]